MLLTKWLIFLKYWLLFILFVKCRRYFIQFTLYPVKKGPFLKPFLPVLPDCGTQKSTKPAVRFSSDLEVVCILNCAAPCCRRTPVLWFPFALGRSPSIPAYILFLRLLPYSLPIYDVLPLFDDSWISCIDPEKDMFRSPLDRIYIHDIRLCLWYCIPIPCHSDIYNSQTLRHRHIHAF